MRLRTILTGAALAAAAAGPAIAAPATYNWTGIVMNSTGDPQQGSAVPVSVTLDRLYPADANTKDPAQEATYTGGLGTPSGKSPILAITVNGVNVQGWFDTVHIEKNLAGVSEITIQSALPQCCRSFSVVLSTTITSVVKSVAIPKTLFPSNFQTAAFNVTYTQNDVFGGTLQ